MKHTIIFITIAAVAYLLIAALPKWAPEYTNYPWRCLGGKNSLVCVGNFSQDIEKIRQGEDEGEVRMKMLQRVLNGDQGQIRLYGVIEVRDQGEEYGETGREEVKRDEVIETEKVTDEDVKVPEGAEQTQPIVEATSEPSVPQIAVLQEEQAEAQPQVLKVKEITEEPVVPVVPEFQEATVEPEAEKPEVEPAQAKAAEVQEPQAKEQVIPDIQVPEEVPELQKPVGLQTEEPEPVLLQVQKTVQPETQEPTAKDEPVAIPEPEEIKEIPQTPTEQVPTETQAQQPASTLPPSLEEDQAFSAPLSDNSIEFSSMGIVQEPIQPEQTTQPEEPEQLQQPDSPQSDPIPPEISSSPPAEMPAQPHGQPAIQPAQPAAEPVQPPTQPSDTQPPAQPPAIQLIPQPQEPVQEVQEVQEGQAVQEESS